MLKIAKTKIDDTEVSYKVEYCHKEINFDIDTKEEKNANSITIVINFSHDTGDEVKTMTSIKIGDTNDPIYGVADENYDFRLGVSDEIDGELAYLFPDATQEERNTVAVEVNTALDKVIEDEGIDIL